MARTTTRTPQSGRTTARGGKAAPPATRDAKAAPAARKPAAAAKPKRGSSMRPGTKRTTEIDRVIGDKIRMRRGELGMTQTELAKAIGVAFQQVQKYEQGRNRVGGSRLDGIAKALQVPVSYFFEQTADDMEVAQGSLLNTRGAVSLLRAYAAITERHQRHALINIARAIAGEEPLGDEDAAH